LKASRREVGENAGQTTSSPSPTCPTKYLLADANGLSGSETLTARQQLTVPKQASFVGS
jgi:hypothetical protein